MTDPRPVPTSVIAVLEEQAQIVSELADVAKQQSSLIAAGATDELLRVLQARQVLVERFDDAQARVATALESDPAPTGAEKERLDDLIETIRTQVEFVLERDEVDRQALVGARDAAGAELKRVDTSRQARRAYTGANPAPTRFADKRG